MEKKLTYEQAVSRLQAIVEKIESGNVDIDTLASDLKEAKQLVSFCKDKLQRVEADVKKVLED